jgi:putative tryptophan/tyrosine transport system substrate-binding protein
MAGAMWRKLSRRNRQVCEQFLGGSPVKGLTFSQYQTPSRFVAAHNGTETPFCGQQNHAVIAFIVGLVLRVGGLMRRRDFITLLGSASAWPLAAVARQLTIPVVGWLNSGPAGDPLFMSLASAFQAGLKDAGYVEGQNVSIDFRWAEGQYSRLAALAADLVAKRVDVIMAGGPPAALAAKAATPTTPIVFTSGDDPVRLGLVASLSRPGGNATGVNLFDNELEAKRLGLLREVVQGATTIGVLLNPKDASFDTQSKTVRDAARAGGFQVVVLSAASEQEIDEAFTTLAQAHATALLIGADPYLLSARKQQIALAAHQSIPAMFSGRAAAADGGLMSYGINFADGYRQAAKYVSRVLKGEKPGDLPVLRPTKFELVINLKTAKTLGLTIPSGVMAIADEVIE